MKKRSLKALIYDYIRIPFSSPRMNYCTFGGIPLGKLVEFYGEEHGGKTTSALDIVGNYQKLPNAKKVLNKIRIVILLFFLPRRVPGFSFRYSDHL